MSSESWERMTSDERRTVRIKKWLEPGIEFVNEQARQTYGARAGRLAAALNHGKPDRVPVNISAGFWPAALAGMTPYDAMNDADRTARAWLDFNLAFEPDAIVSPLEYCPPAAMLAALDYRLFSWPGQGVPRGSSYQYNEKEWMLAEEYDRLISDPSGYMLGTYLPRTVGAFAGFAGLPSLFGFSRITCVGTSVLGWGGAELAAGLQRLAGAVEIFQGWQNTLLRMVLEAMSRGFPPYAGSGTLAPFDILGDFLRGTKGLMMDMYRQPEKVAAACERLVPVAIDMALGGGDPPTPVTFIPLHKGADGFMNDEQFRRFYWPSLEALILGLVEQGMIPLLFAEGRYNTRLEAIRNLPAASTVWHFDQTDMGRAKATVGRVACIEGNMPLSLLHSGTPGEVADRTRSLIDVAGEGGGFILDMGAVADEGREENLRAMISTVKEYGSYR